MTHHVGFFSNHPPMYTTNTNNTLVILQHYNTTTKFGEHDVLNFNQLVNQYFN